MAGMQREVLAAFLATYDRNDVADDLKSFIRKSVQHHVSCLSPPADLYLDPLLMGLLSRNDSLLCGRVVTGIGVERLQKEIDKCEERSRWLEAAQLWYALTFLHGQRAGAEVIRSLAAVRKVPEASDQSRLLEIRSSKFYHP